LIIRLDRVFPKLKETRVLTRAAGDIFSR